MSGWMLAGAFTLGYLTIHRRIVVAHNREAKLHTKVHRLQQVNARLEHTANVAHYLLQQATAERDSATLARWELELRD